jgi:hypothetical protein
MRTDDLIADLAGRVTPVRPLPAPGIRALAWFVVASACAGAGVAVFGARPNVDSLLTELDFLLAGILALGTTLLGALAALILSIPGAERTPALRAATIGVVALWVVMLGSSVALAGKGFSGISHWYVCFIRVMAIGLIPAMVIVVMLRRAMPLRTGWVSALAMLGAAAIGAFAIQFICPLTDAGHALVGHLGPVVVAGLAGAAMGTRWGR